MSKENKNKKAGKKCPFCNLEKLDRRIFYNQGNWVGFLAAQYHTKGHTILAAHPKYGCPKTSEKLHDECWKTLGVAIKTVVDSLMKYYKSKGVKDILFASLRGKIKHFHLHLIPLWQEEEKKWRKEKQHEDGHLFEFCGDLESSGDLFYKKERYLKDWTKEEQIKENTKLLELHAKRLRKITGYKT